MPQWGIFHNLKEANIVIQQCRKHYNTIRPHSSDELLTVSTANVSTGNTPTGSQPGDAEISISLVQNIRQVHYAKRRGGVLTLRLWQVGTHLAEFLRPLQQPAPAPLPLFLWGSRIAHPFNLLPRHGLGFAGTFVSATLART
jgi:hypothetical protein